MPIHFTFGATGARFPAPIEFQRQPASNEYVADVSPDLTANAGEYELIINATIASSGAGEAAGCVLLRRKITVVGALDVQMVIIGVVLGVLLAAVLVLVIYLIRSHKAAVKRILISFVKNEVILAVKIAVDLWVRERSALRVHALPCSSRWAIDRCKLPAGSRRRPYERQRVLSFSLHTHFVALTSALCSVQLSRPLSE